MSACERCWRDASAQAAAMGGSVSDRYAALLVERANRPCSIEDAIGPYLGKCQCGAPYDKREGCLLCRMKTASPPRVECTCAATDTPCPRGCDARTPMTIHRIRDDDSKDAFEIEGVRCVRETDAAICCVGASGRERWVPKSVVHDDSFVFETGQSGTLVVKRWWAEKQGWA